MKVHLSIACFLLILVLTYCTTKPTEMIKSKIDVQGHRGARGLMPENTIPAFIKALELGVTTLELDLVVTKDKQLLVSHDPFMHHQISLDSLSQNIKKEDEGKHNIYQMTYDQVKKYDVGSKFVTRFPDQVKMKIHKPLFIELVDSVKAYSLANNISNVRYNIEIKSLPVDDNLYQPVPAEFCKLVYDFVQDNMKPSQVNVQSFDFRVLQYFHQNYPEVKLAMLIENTLSIDDNLKNLGFTPEIYSCYHPLLDSAKVEYLHSLDLKVIPWTVNDPKDIEKMIKWNVDGIISDYPNRILDLLNN